MHDAVIFLKRCVCSSLPRRIQKKLLNDKAILDMVLIGLKYNAILALCVITIVYNLDFSIISPISDKWHVGVN